MSNSHNDQTNGRPSHGHVNSKRKHKLLIEQLEERVLFDAVPGLPIDEPVGDLPSIAAEVASVESGQQNGKQDVARREVLFVDKSVDGYETLVADFVASRDVDVFFINDQSDGFQQIAEHLQDRAGIDAIHIVSHGSEANLWLGRGAIGVDQLTSENAVDLTRIGQSLSVDADILLYGCELASSEEGLEFIQLLGELTGADVAASDDVTGSNVSGVAGDWQLERQTGAIETNTLSSSRFEGQLLVTDNGFVVGTGGSITDGQVVITPEGQGGTSSLLYEDAATANGGTINIDLRLTLVDTYDENGVVTTGTANQLPVIFGNWSDSPVLLSRGLSGSISGFEGHTAEIRVDFFDGDTGQQLSVVGEFTFHDIDFEPGTSAGSGAERVTVRSNELQQYLISDTPTSEIDVIDNGDGTTSFTNDSSSGSAADEERWATTIFYDLTSLTLNLQARNGHTGYGLSTKQFTSTPLSFAQPIATDDAFATDQDTAISGNVITADNGNGVDNDPDGDPLSVSLVDGQAANLGVATAGSNGGLFTINSDGSFDFDPGNDFIYLPFGQTATTTITYEIVDGTGLADMATVTVTVTGTDDVPHNLGAIPDQLNVEAQPLTLDLSSYFGYDSTDVVSYDAGSTLPPGLTIDNAGVVTGTPTNMTAGSYGVSITLSNTLGESTTQTFTWVITNPAPIATNNSGTVVRDAFTSTSGNVITDDDGNGIDADPDGDSFSLTAVNGSGANIGSIVNGSFGQIVIGSDGSYTYTLDSSNPTVVAMAPGDVLNDSFTYTVTDAQGESSTATLNISIENNPVWTLTGDTSVVEGLVAQYVLEFSDALAPGESVSVDFSIGNIDTSTTDYADFVTAVNNAIAGRPELSFDGTTLTFTSPSGTAYQETFDNAGGGFVDISSSGTSLAITDETNLAANIGFDFEFFGTTYNQLFVHDNGYVTFGSGINNQFNNGDIDGGTAFGGRPAIAALWDDMNPVSGSIFVENISSGGSNQFVIQWENTPHFNVGGTNGVSFQIVLTEGSNEIEFRYQDVNFGNVNFNDGASATIGIQDGAGTGIEFSQNTASVNAGATLTYSIPLVTLAPVVINLGTVDDVLSEANEDYVVSISNGVGASIGLDNQVTTTIIDNDNIAPTATNNANAVTEDLILSSAGNVIVDDDGSGVDNDPNGDDLSVSAVDGLAGNVNSTVAGTYGSIVINADGSYTYNLNNAHPVVNALGATESLTESFAYTISDGNGGFDSATLTITINGTNDAPELKGSLPSQSGVDGDTGISVDVAGVFDDPEGDSLTFSASGLPAGLSINSSGLITGTIDNSASQGGVGGVYTVTVTAEDPSGETVSTTFTWTVTNPGPTATDNTATVTEDTALSDSGNVISDNDGSGVDSDPDNDTLSVTAIDGVAGDVGSTVTGSFGSIVINSDGTYTYTLENGNAAVNALDATESLTESFDYTISDGEGGTSTATLTITINGTNDAPVVGGTIPPQTDVDAASGISVDTSGAFGDPEGDTLTFSASGLPAGLSINSSGLITGTIDNSASQGGVGGVYTVTVTAEDPSGETVSTTFTWTVTNPGPTATDNTSTVTEDTALTDSGNVISDNDGSGVDSDPDNDALTVTAIDGVAGDVGSTVTGSFGSVVINSDGTYTYTLENGNAAVNALDATESLTESFDYTISDGEGGTSTATLTITINGTNDAPLVGGTIPPQNDVDAASGISVDTSGAFGDPEGDTLTFSASGLPAGLSINPSGLITGTIDNSASQGGVGGVYTVTVTAEDPSGETVSTTFTWTVTNPGPTATDNTATVTEDTSLADSGNVISDNDGSGVDSDPDNDTLTVTAIDGVAGDVGSTVTGSFGSVVINSDGTYTYNLDNGNAAVNALDATESLTESFGYTISDGEGGTSTATLTITINGTNDAPVVGGTIPPQADVDAASGISVDASGAFGDPEGDTLTFSASGLPAGLSINSSGLITGTIDNSASQGGVGGVYTVTVTAEDPSGETVSTTFTWTVTNPGPTATDNTATVTEDTALTDSGNVISDNDGSGVDSDPDNDTLTVTAIDGVAGDVGSTVTGSFGSVVINSDGTYTYTLDNGNAAVNALDATESLTESFDYTISDGEGGTSTATLTITINGTNDAPVVGGTIPPQNDVDAASGISVDTSGAFGDPEGDTLTFSASGLPAGLSINSSGLITGTIDNSASQGGVGGVYTVTVTAEDPSGETVSTTFTWTVTNPGPTATDNTATVTEDTALTDSGNVISDNDGSGVDSDPDNDTLTVTAIDGVAGDVGSTVTGSFGSIVINSDGTYTFTLDNGNAAVNALDATESLTESFDYTISDGEGGTSTATLTITINGTNDAPVVGGTIPSQNDVDAASGISVDTSGAFGDPEGDTLTFSASGLPAGLSINSSGLITGTIDNSASQGGVGGVYTVTVTAEDPSGETVSTTFTWTVTNPGPTATDNTATVTEDTSLADSGNVISDNDGSGVDSDPDNDSLTVTAIDGVAGDVGSTVTGSFGSIVINSDGTYTYTLDNGNATVNALDATESLTESFDYTISDGEGGTSTATLTITINGTNDAPVVGGTIPPQNDVDAASGISVDTSGAFGDPEGDTLTFSASGLPAGLSINPSGLITGTIDNSASQGGVGGVYTVTVTAEDPSGETVSTTFTWTVTNPGPTATDNTATVTEDTSLADSGNVISDNDGSGVDSDPDNDTLTVTAIDGVAGDVGSTVTGSFGSVVINSDGTYTYTLDNGNAAVNALDATESLTESFDYTISDGEGGTSTAMLTITINGTNDAPVVGGTIPPQTDVDAASGISVDTSGAFGDPEGDTLTFSASGLPAGLSINSSGLITGTIDNSASQGGVGGVYTVTVTAEDPSGETVSTTFTWTVTNPGPTATDNTATVTEDTALTDSGNVISDNDGSGVDSDPDNDTLTVTAIDGVAGDVGSTVTGSFGSIVINSDGTYTFTLDNGNAAVNALDATESLTESFDYTISDGEGGTSTATLTITINGTNDAPVVGGTIPSQNDVDAASGISVDTSGAFGDPEGDTLTFSASGLPAGLSINSSGLITGTIDNSASQGGVGGVYTVTVTAEDPSGETVSTTFTWTVTNPGPTATDNTATVTEDTSLADSGNVISDNDGSGVDSDPDNDSLTVTEIDGVAGDVGSTVMGSFGSIVINSDGTYTYTLENGNAAVNALDATESLTESFDYTISDGEGGTSTATLTITINGTNDAPVVGGTIPPQNDVDAASGISVDTSGAFGDPEGDSLTFSASGLPAGLSINSSGLITGTIDNSASQGGVGGVYTVTVTAEDPSGETVSTTFTWTVTNPGPTATDNTATVTEDTSLADSGNVISDNDGSGVDSDPDNDTLTVTAIDGVAGDVGSTVTGSFGSIVINSDGTYTFTLDNGNAAVNALDATESLTESFDYTISDGEGGTSTATLTITINGTNDAPVVGGTIPSQNDVDAASGISVDTSGAFGDPEGDTLTFSASGLPAGLSINSSGLITGTIDNSASQGGVGGVYTVTVTAEDPSGETVSTTFTWTVTNPGPTATDNTATVTEDTALSDSGNVISDNDGSGVDSDPDNDTLTVTAIDGVAGDVGSTVTGSFGSIVINSDGTYTFTLDNGNAAVNALDATESLTESFDYTISDGEGGTSTATLTITINGTNDAPVVGGTIPPQNDVDAASGISVDTSGAFGDPEGDTLTFSASGLPAGLSINSSGLITGTIDNSASQGGVGGVYTVTVTAEDPSGETVSTTFTWTVTNPGPTATDNTATVTEDTALTDSGNVISDNDGSGVDSDPDNDTLTVTAIDGVAGDVGSTVTGSFGSVVINSDGTYTYTLDNGNAAVNALDATESLTESFDYTISDGEGGTSTATLTITINGTNDAPVVGGTIPPQNDVDAASGISVDTSGAFGDPEGDSLTFSASGLPAGLSISATGIITGTIDNSASQGGVGGVYTVTVTAEDPSGETVSTTFTWTVTNPGPTATNNTATVTEDTALTDSGNVISDNDGSGVDSDPDNDTLSVTAIDGVAGDVGSTVTGSFGSVVINSDGTYTYTLDNGNAAVNALDATESLTESFDYTISDGEGGTSTATLTITINGTNDAPVVGGTIPPQTDVDAASGISVDTSGAFGDPEGDSLTFSASGLPAGLSINSSGLITGTIDNSASQGGVGGVYTVTVTAEDPSGETVSTTFTWTVTNPGPTATNNTATVTEDTALTDSGNVISDNDGSGVDSDPDNDTLTVTAIDGVAGDVGSTVTGSFGSIVINSDGTYTFTLDNGNAAVNALDATESLTESFDYTISDGEGGTSTATLTITINGTNDAPVVGGTIPPQNDVDAASGISVDTSGAFGDPEGDSLTFSASGLPAGLSINSSGLITGTIDNSASQGGVGGVYTVTVTAEDPSGETVSTTFTWTVTNPGPTATNNTATVTEDTALTDSGNVISDNDGSGVDSDPDNDTLTVTAIDGVAGDVGSTVTGSFGSVVINSDGTYTYTLDNGNAAVNALDATESLTESFDYTISDGEGGTSTATLTITINGTNDAPVVGGTIPPQNDVDAASGISVDTSGAFGDPEGDSLTFSASGLPAGLSINSSGLITGTIDNSASQGGVGGVYTVTVTAEDPSGETVSTTFTWTVTNPGPTATDNTATVTEDTSLADSGNVISDNDGSGVDSDPDNDTLTVTAIDGVAGDVGSTVTGSFGSIVINSDGTYTFTLDNGNAAVNALDATESLTDRLITRSAMVRAAHQRRR